jgi:DNA gyrase/topoisomerase IV subunit A
MTENEEYTIHNDYDKIIRAINELREIDEETTKKLKGFVSKIKAIDNKLKPAMKRQTFSQNERELWKTYQNLQAEKLTILDLAHEWEYIAEISTGLTKEVSVLVRDAIEELEDHVAIIVETLKAHIDILEIKNSRQFGLLALIVSLIISYVAVWEFFVRDIITNAKFPLGLSPDLNFALSIVALVPLFVIVIWGWRQRLAED